MSSYYMVGEWEFVMGDMWGKLEFVKGLFAHTGADSNTCAGWCVVLADSLN